MIHPARTMPYDELARGLRVAAEAGRVGVAADGDLRIYCYTKSTVYHQSWDAVTLAARGLVLDVARGEVVATPFPKFFNLGERPDPVPDSPFEACEKLDGSLVILFRHAGRWRAATKASFTSDQAKWAEGWLAGRDLSALEPGTTYLAEAIYPENRVVIHYETSGLILLAAYRGDGAELSYDALLGLGARLGWGVVARRAFASVGELVTHTRALPASREGYVLRFADGTRLKVKGDEYRRLHRAITGLTPLAVWAALEAGDDLDRIRRDLPEEYWGDFDAILALLTSQLDALLRAIDADAAAVAQLTDKELGTRLGTLPELARSFAFPHRKSGGRLLESRGRRQLFQAIRPEANRLAGYVPSRAVRLAGEESG